MNDHTMSTATQSLADPSLDLMDALPDATLIIGGHGRIVFFNSQAEVLFGYARHEILDRALATLLPQAPRHANHDLVTQYLSTPAARTRGYVVELAARHRSGREIPVEFALSPIHYRGELMVLAGCRDITARKQTEVAWRDARNRLAALLDCSKDGVISTDGQGRILHLNTPAQRLTGWAEEKAIGHAIADIFRIVDTNSHAPFSHPVPGTAGEAQVLELPAGTRLLRHDGQQLGIEGVCAPVHVSGTASQGAVYAFRESASALAEHSADAEKLWMRQDLDCVPVAVVRLDRHGRITQVNEAWRSLARDNGADAQTVSGLGQDYLEATSRIGQACRAAANEVLTGMLSSEQDTCTAYYSCRSAEGIRWLRMDAYHAPGREGIVLTHTDVSDHHLAEARLHIQTVTTQGLVEQMSLIENCKNIAQNTCAALDWEVCVIWLPGEDGFIRCVDFWTKDGFDAAAFERQTRDMVIARGDELPGRVWDSIAPEWEEDLTQSPGFLRAPLAAAAGLQTCFAVPLGAEGEVFAVMEFFGTARRTRDIKLLVSFAILGAQISAQVFRERAEKRARAELAQRERIGRTLDAVMESAPVYIAVLDEAGIIQFINRVPPHYRQSQSIVGSDWLTHVAAEEHEQHRARLNRVIATNKAETYDTMIRSADGEQLWYSSHIGPLREGDRVVGAVVISQEVTELKRTQEEFAAAQRLSAVGTLAAGIAHEINTPIQFVNDSVHFLRDAARDVLDLMGKLREVRRQAQAGDDADALQQAIASALDAEEIADIDYLNDNMPSAFDRCIEGLDRVATIVRSMKEFAHPAHKEMTSMDLNRAIQSTFTIARNEYKYVAEVETDFEEVPMVTCYPGEINQVILNLIVNAAHAIADAVKGTENKGVIRIGTRQDASHVTVSIADSGTGIPKEIGQRIFEPFFTTKEVGKGTGQGLALAWNVIRNKHGGDLWFESEVGKGTTFFIRLPIQGRPAAARDAAQ